MYNGHSWDWKKVSVVLRWLLFRGCLSKISISIVLMGFRPVVVDRWSLFRGGRKFCLFGCFRINIFFSVLHFKANFTSQGRRRET